VTVLVKVEEFNDPGCPFGYSAEQHRRRIEWLYGSAIDIDLRLVGVLNNPDELDKRGFTVERMMGAWRGLSESHGMPFNFTQPQRHSATIPACRAIAAAGMHSDKDRVLMRWLRIKRFSGEVIDEQGVIDDAAKSAGIDPDELAKWVASGVTDKTLAADMEAARSPKLSAQVLDHRLADANGGRRYTCPTWEIEGVAGAPRFTLPGFQPFDSYEVVLANLLPEVKRNPAPTDPTEVLWWAGEPLATREVGVVMEISDEDAHDALKGSGATEIPLQSSSFWVR
jgi:predicted DsbA family dithiol-disulfide isomerase